MAYSQYELNYTMTFREKQELLLALQLEFGI